MADELVTKAAVKHILPRMHFLGPNEYQLAMDDIDKLPPAQQWTPCSKKLPDNEQDVMVTVEVRRPGYKPFRKVIKAFYTDGRHTDADSAYSWDDLPDPQYDDDDNLLIPEGWWESSDYSDEIGMIDDFVLAWCELLTPWAGNREE